MKRLVITLAAVLFTLAGCGFQEAGSCDNYEVRDEVTGKCIYVDAYVE